MGRGTLVSLGTGDAGMIRGEDIMGWVLVASVVAGSLYTMIFLLPPKKDQYICTENEVYLKQQGENFWRKQNVHCIPEDKQ